MRASKIAGWNFGNFAKGKRAAVSGSRCNTRAGPAKDKTNRTKRSKSAVNVKRFVIVLPSVNVHRGSSTNLCVKKQHLRIQLTP
jgi:hypothetical protein